MACIGIQVVINSNQRYVDDRVASGQYWRWHQDLANDWLATTGGGMGDTDRVLDKYSKMATAGDG